MLIKKSQFESLILCKDRDFKHRAVNFLNNIAFNAEKQSVENIQEAKALIETNPRILNVIIDGTDFKQLLDGGGLKDLQAMCQKPELMAAMYVPEADQAYTKKEHGISNFFCFVLPFEKNQFNLVFHSRGAQKGDGGSSPLSVFQGAKKPAASQVKPQESESSAKKNVIAFETSGHLKSSLAMLNIVEKNREALDQVQKVGQIFNGLVGALAYFGNKAGYKQLRNLAIMIDEVSRCYDDKKSQKISDDHFKLFYQGSINSFKILQHLREEKEVEASLIESSEALFSTFSSMEEFKDKHTCDQDEIDKLLGDQ